MASWDGGRVSKYGAKPIEIDGIRFTSQKEGRRYQELRLLEKAGEIFDFRLQQAFPLKVGEKVIGKYVADFWYRQHDGAFERHVIEDVKGFRTPLYKWKKRHVEAQYCLQIVEI